MSHDTDVQVILQLMLERWNLEIPNLVISVTGGAKSFVLKPRLKEVFRRGLIKAAKSTSAWIITGLHSFCNFRIVLMSFPGTGETLYCSLIPLYTSYKMSFEVAC